MTLRKSDSFRKTNILFGTREESAVRPSVFFVFFPFFSFFSIFQNFFLRTAFGRLVRGRRFGQKISCNMSKCAPPTSRVRFCPLPHSTIPVWGQRSHFNPHSTQTIPWLGSPSGPRSRSPSLTKSFMTLSASTLSSFPR